MTSKISFKIFGREIILSWHKEAPVQWQATHIHRKGGAYRYLLDALLESDESPVVVYDDPIGNVWVRSKAEFDDGRFTAIAQAQNVAGARPK